KAASFWPRQVQRSSGIVTRPSASPSASLRPAPVNPWFTMSAPPNWGQGRKCPGRSVSLRSILFGGTGSGHLSRAFARHRGFDHPEFDTGLAASLESCHEEAVHSTVRL